MLRGLRIGSFRIAACLTVAMAMPAHEAAAQDAIGGAIIGGVGGAILGGALGGGRGAAIGAVVGAGTGAAIASEGERRRSGYYPISAAAMCSVPTAITSGSANAIAIDRSAAGWWFA